MLGIRMLLLLVAMQVGQAEAQDTSVKVQTTLRSRARPDLPKSLADAEAVIRGTVIDVQYRLSERRKDAEEVPHAFVTYKVEDVLRGAVAGRKTVTLRFIGGPGKGGDILSVEDVPLFS